MVAHQRLHANEYSKRSTLAGTCCRGALMLDSVVGVGRLGVAIGQGNLLFDLFKQNVPLDNPLKFLKQS